MNMLRLFKEQKKPVLLVFGVLLLVLSVGISTNSRANAQDVDMTSEEQYAEAYNVTIDEAKIRLELQSLMSDLSNELHDGEDEIGGIWIEHEPKFRLYISVTKDEARIAKKYLHNKAWTRKYVKIVKVDVMLSELVEIQDAISESMNDSGIVFVSSLLQDQAKVVIRTTDVKLFEKGVKETLKNSSVERTYKKHIDVIEDQSVENIQPATVIKGGQQLQWGIKRCTSGFIVTLNGNRYLSTAGHCNDSLTNYNGKYLGNLVYENDPYYDGDPFTKDLQLHDAASEGFSLTNIVQTPWGSGSQQQIWGEQSKWGTEGQWVCKNGWKTSYTCGVIVSVQENLSWNGNVSGNHFVRVNHPNPNTTLVCGGDSGGPVFNGTKAYGWVTASFDRCSNWSKPNDYWFTPVNAAWDAGIHVLTSQ